ncbi:MAG TPA: serine hydrolase [Candidatus Dormibacteraeota bacterium]|nr:serine hydrolase [Candidatus Dormibacteraeota bacterium]
MVGRAAPSFAAHRLRGVALLAALLLTSSIAIWTATPVPTSGQVMDSAGQPVAGAVVTEAASAFAPAGQVRSDPLGRYRLGARRWPYAAPTLTVVAEGFEPATTSGGRLVLHRVPAVAGRVVDDTGDPLAGAVVTLSQLSAVLRAGVTDVDGRFALQAPGHVGTATVSAAMDAHDSVSEAVSLVMDRLASITLTLARQLATLHVESDPRGQAPQVDGAPAAACPATPCDLTVPAGQHEVAFDNDLFLPWTTEVQVAKNGTVAVTAHLVRKTGTLMISAPAQGELSIDDQPVGAAPWSGAVPTGQHTVADRSGATWPALAQTTISWNQTTQVSLTPVAIAPGDTAAFGANLRKYLGAQGGGSFGVYLEELGSGTTIGLGDTTPLEAASVIKVPEALYLLRQVDAGQVTLDNQIDLHPEDFMSGTGTLFGTAHPGDMYSYQQLLTLLIRQSDNTAWMALRRVLGSANIDAYAALIGARDCVQETDQCSARSAGHLLAQLARGSLLSATSTQLLLGLLETTIFNDRIPYYLGGTTVAHKVGIDPDNGVANDCGVVFASGDPFAVCVLTTTADPDNGVQVIRDIARAAVRLW